MKIHIPKNWSIGQSVSWLVSRKGGKEGGREKEEEREREGGGGRERDGGGREELGRYVGI